MFVERVDKKQTGVSADAAKVSRVGRVVLDPAFRWSPLISLVDLDRVGVVVFIGMR